MYSARSNYFKLKYALNLYSSDISKIIDQQLIKGKHK